MGCDIHCFVEKKVDGKWHKISGFVSDYYEEGHEYFGTDEFKKADSPINSRNYTLFSVLADVRNGYGFAGCDTGDAIKPISGPKGLSDNVSDEIENDPGDDSCDGHSHSWLTVKEILDYDWNSIQTERGYVNPEEFKAFLEKGQPSSWCGGVSGGNVVKISTDKMKELIENEVNDGKSYYCQIQWHQKLKDNLEYFLDNSLNQLKERCESSNFDDIRIVFWFDN